MVKTNEFASKLLDILGLPASGCTALTIEVKAGAIAEVNARYVLEEDEKLLELLKAYKLVNKHE